jgi:ubiquinone/menaquinone biosynthesis C-methylase UbiE
VHGTLRRMHGSPRGGGTTLEAFGEMYRVTRPGGRLLVADFDPSRQVLPLHRGARRMQHAAASTGPLDDLATAAGYRIQAHGTLPLLRYVTAVKQAAP